MQRKLLAYLIAVLLISSLLPSPIALAAPADHIIEATGSTVVFNMAQEGVQNGDTIQVKSGAKAYIIGSPQTTYQNVFITCESGAGSHLTLRNVNINSAENNILEFEIGTDEYTLTLLGENHFNHTGASITLYAGCPLVIDGFGSLYIQSSEDSILLGMSGTDFTLSETSFVSVISNETALTAENIHINGRIFASGLDNSIVSTEINAGAESLGALGNTNIVGATNPPSVVRRTLELSYNGSPLPADTTVYMYVDGEFAVEAVVLASSFLFIWLQTEDCNIHFTMDEGSKATDPFLVSTTSMVVPLTFEDVIPPSSMTIDMQGTILTSGAPVTDKDAILRTEAKVVPLDSAGEFLYKDVALYDHNLIIDDEFALIQFEIGDALTWSQSGHVVTVTLTKTISNIDMTWDLGVSGLILTNVTTYVPSDNPATGDR